MLSAIDPVSYDYAGVSKWYATDLTQADYEHVIRWWDELNLYRFVKIPKMRDVSARVLCA